MFPPHRVYVEPFGGAASVLVRKGRCHAEIYNDLDGDVVNLFRVVRDSGTELRRLIEMTPYARDEFRLSWEPTLCPIEKARRMLVRSYMGFGSAAATEARENGRVMTGFRSCSNRSGTTPAQDWKNYPQSLALLVDRLQGVVVENRQAAEVMLAHDSVETLHYVDPPYVASSRDTGADYRHELTDEGHRELCAVLRRLKGRVLISGYHSELYDQLFADWCHVERTSHADGARARTEVLWMNFRPETDLFRI